MTTSIPDDAVQAVIAANAAYAAKALLWGNAARPYVMLFGIPKVARIMADALRGEGVVGSMAVADELELLAAQAEATPDPQGILNARPAREVTNG
ncbi:MAG: hypothetical protein ABI780_01785 [Ardenticatenales bacterium]